MNDIERLWINSISEDTKMIAYRPAFRAIAGSVTSAILLQQILYRWKNNGFQPFYKYKEPCDASDYRPGDSWCEELAFSRSEFDTALKGIAQKVSRKVEKDESKLVWYWTMSDRKTWYELNYSALCKAAFPLYVAKDSSVTKTVNPAIDIPYTKNTSENTSRDDKTTITPDRAEPGSRRRQPPTPAKDGSAKPDPFYAEMQTAIESNGFGMMTPIMAGEVKKMITTYPAEWIREAMRIAVSSNALRLAYVNGVLENWQREGFSYDSRKHHSDRKGSTNGAAKRTNQQGTGKDEPADDYHANAWYANLGTPSV